MIKAKIDLSAGKRSVDMEGNIVTICTETTSLLREIKAGLEENIGEEGTNQLMDKIFALSKASSDEASEYVAEKLKELKEQDDD